MCSIPLGLGDKMIVCQVSYPVTERVSDQLVRLPFHNGLSQAEAQQVVEAVREFEF